MNTSHPAPGARLSAVRTVDSARTRLSDGRAEGRRAAARLLRAASAVCSLRQVAAALDVSPSRVEDLADEEHPAAVALGDLLAAPTGFAEAVLVGALAEVRRRRCEAKARLRVELRALRLNALLGEYSKKVAEALADGVLDEEEAADLQRTLGALDRETEDAARDLAVGQ